MATRHLVIGALVVSAGLTALVLSRRASAAVGPNDGPAPSSGSCGPPYGELDGIEVMSGGAARGDDVPVHVTLHGLGNKPSHMVPYLEKFDAPMRHIALRGTTSYGSGRGWTVERCASKDQAKLAAQMTWTADRVESAIAAISACFKRPVIVSGFSNGGSMAYAIAARNLPAVERVVAVSGCLPESLRATTMSPTIGIHGTHDDTVPFATTAVWATEHPWVAFHPIQNGGHGLGEEALALWRLGVAG